MCLRRFVLYDQRGSLRSPAPDASITFDRHIEDLELLRRELGLERLTLVGHSMGAILASAYATRYPTRIERLVLISPAYLKNPIPESEKPLQHQGYLASQAFLGRDAVARELQAYRLERSEPPLSSQEETAKFRIGSAARMLADVTKWRQMEGGRALFKAHVGPLTTKTYPPGGWDYVAEFAQRDDPVGIIVGDRDFVDMGTPLLSAWSRAVPRLELTLLARRRPPAVDRPAGSVSDSAAASPRRRRAADTGRTPGSLKLCNPARSLR